jgi:two-component system, NtrC family, sensor kinase
MEGRGVLTVRASRNPSGDGVVIEVCDSGPGVPDEIRQRLFEPFYTTKPPGKGTGLGLHIAHNVIARHGGRIDVESSSEGTCFRIALPPRPPDVDAPP